MRFIPAGAGNTNVATDIRCCLSVYPRWRGEHIVVTTPAAPIAGLSPLARGTPHDLSRWFSDWRFIPAGAGNTRRRGQLFRRSAVYPRWRGEHASGGTCNVNVTGLSPLARGTRPRCGHAPGGIRFIPAGAGNTCPFNARIRSASVYPRWRGEHSKSTQLNLNTFLAHKKPTNFS